MDFSSPADSRGKRHHERAEELLVHLAAEYVARESNSTSLITVTRAELSAKGERVSILVSVFPEDRTPEALEFLNRHADDFRSYLKSHARLRDLPRITFVEDAGERNRQHLDELGSSA